MNLLSRSSPSLTSTVDQVTHILLALRNSNHSFLSTLLKPFIVLKTSIASPLSPLSARVVSPHFPGVLHGFHQFCRKCFLWVSSALLYRLPPTEIRQRSMLKFGPSKRFIKRDKTWHERISLILQEPNLLVVLLNGIALSTSCLLLPRLLESRLDPFTRLCFPTHIH